MANEKVPCRVCGKLFIPCGKTSAMIGAFNYREVACSPECGKEYMRRVIESRQVKTEKSKKLKIDKDVTDDKQEFTVDEMQ